jgi:putative tryptophan/tyrosine transport system substrate-binding protein
MRRRQFIASLGAASAYAAVPRLALAQQGTQVRRVGALMALAEADPESRALLSGLRKGLAELGWIEGHTVRLEVRWAAGRIALARMYAKELVALRPDVIFADSTPEASALHQETRTIPIVFALVSDPVGEGFIAGLPRPGGNMTGFIPHEPAVMGKLLELLTQIAPGAKRVAIMFNPDSAPYVESQFLPHLAAAAQSFNLAPIMARVHNDAEIETAITALGSEAGGGLVVMPGVYMNVHRATTISVAARHHVPVVYASSEYARDGGLISYGADLGDMFRRAASYVDRILRGANPAELPVQLPVKFEMAVNLKTAKALGLTIPPILLATADEVIE